MAEHLWTGVAEAYARGFARLCAGTVSTMLSGIDAGTRLLDVGCGTGTLVESARAAGIDATGVEPDPEMAALAGRRIGEVVVAGLPELPFDDGSFEVVTANFVLNHVDDPRLAARELSRVVAPGGVVRATVWPADPPPHGALWSAVLDRAGAVRPKLPRLAEDLDFERSAEGLAAMLSESGLASGTAATLAWTWRVDPDDFLVGVGAVGNFGVTWRAQTDEVRRRMRDAYAEEVASRLVDGQLAFDVRCAYAEARAAG